MTVTKLLSKFFLCGAVS